MSEVVVVATFKVKPGKEEEAERMLRAVIAPTHAEEGCLTYAFHRGLDDPTQFAMVERWASREALDAHLQTPHVAQLSSAVDLLAEPPQIVFAEALPEGDADKGTL